jgi:hypothetical protein
MRTTHYIIMLVILGLVLSSVPVEAANWQWQLSRDRYQRLNPFERAQYDKAAGLYQGSQFLAAASEFEKFCIQFEDTEPAYMRLMRAMSLHYANNRNTAIKVYQDVIDYFGADERYRDEVIAATFWRGAAYLDSGDMLNGLRVMKRMVENPDFRTHVLTAGALRRLADNHFANTEYEQAVRYWQQTIRDFRKLNDEEVRYANNNYVLYTVVTKGYRAYDNFYASIATEKEKEDNNFDILRANYMDEFYSRVYWLYHHHEAWRWRKVWPLDKDETKHKALEAAERKAYYEYVRASKPAYEGANRLWNYYRNCQQIVCHLHWSDKAEREKLTQEAVAWIKTLEDKDRQDQYYAQLIEFIASHHLQEGQLARYVKGQMNNKLFAEYQEGGFILYAERKHREAVTVLEGVEAAAKGQLADTALNRRAWMLKDVMGAYEEAITAYSTMSNPPHNLWHIAECYQRWSNSDKSKLRLAINQLGEIEASFPDWAPRAAWHASSWCHHGGDREGAIRHARRVMRQYPKSGESSAAHQYLESQGIKDIGGAVGEEIK